MDAEDKQPRIMKPSKSRARDRVFVRYSFYGLTIALTIAVIVLVVHTSQNSLRTRRSSNLVSTVKGLEDGKHHCSDGLKQIGSVGSSLSSPNRYNITARISGLSYLMACTFTAGDVKQALIYAGQLDKLYSQDSSKNSQKHRELAQFVNYMKNYQQ